jgi:hypothetical protein
VYASKNKTSKCRRQKLIELKYKIDKSTIPLKDLQPLSVICRNVVKSVRSYIFINLNNTINFPDLIDVYRPIYSTIVNAHPFQEHMKHSSR